MGERRSAGLSKQRFETWGKDRGKTNGHMRRMIDKKNFEVVVTRIFLVVKTKGWCKLDVNFLNFKCFSGMI
jgi:hypothetical protein